MTKPGSTPARKQIAASTNMAASENSSTSVAACGCGERGRPRKITPNALTKQAAASAADKREQRADGRDHQA